MARKLTRLFLEEDLFEKQMICLSLEQSHYLLHVLRLKKDDCICVFNAAQGEWLAIIMEDAKKQVLIKVQENIRKFQSHFSLTLVFAPLKPRAMDILIEKSTELGVTSFQPVWTQRTQGRDFNNNRYRSLAREASEQSERLTIPEFQSPLGLFQFIEEWPPEAIIFIGDERQRSPSLFSSLQEKSPSTISSMTVMIGPEGGFTEQEFSFLEQQSFCQFVSLGPTILRSETASLYALSLAQARMFSQSQIK